MKFWETHSKEMRRARLLAASAIIFSQDPSHMHYIDNAAVRSVEATFKLEELITTKLNKESK